uniref:AVID protein n=1 Tax=Bubo bubo TaxID=30461 RepID=A0A8C0FZB3_BUBBB
MGCPLLSPCLCLGCAAAPTQSSLLQCVLTGQWKNDLGSNMTIGELQGISLTSTILESPLLGSQKHTHQPTFGFTVKWTFTGASPFQASLTVPRTALPSLWCPQSRCWVDWVGGYWRDPCCLYVHRHAFLSEWLSPDQPEGGTG